jgi:hypothetical protein
MNKFSAEMGTVMVTVFTRLESIAEDFLMDVLLLDL